LGYNKSCVSALAVDEDIFPICYIVHGIWSPGVILVQYLGVLEILGRFRVGCVTSRCFEMINVGSPKNGFTVASFAENFASNLEAGPGWKDCVNDLLEVGQKGFVEDRSLVDSVCRWLGDLGGPWKEKASLGTNKVRVHELRSHWT
jgi:hypothetical protein